MEAYQTTLNGVLRLVPPTIFQDHRGIYVETYNEKLYYDAGVLVKFVQDDISVSYHNVLRGIHGDYYTWKLISCLRGRLYLVVVNWIRESPQYKQWEGFYLDDNNHQQILVPPGFGNGHVVMSSQAIFHYKQSTYYNRELQFTILWDDPELSIDWPVNHPVLSNRDRGTE